MRFLRTIPLLLVSLATVAAPTPAAAGVFVSVTVAPPALPVYVQPPCPADGYLWTPGYWAYGPEGYYWVPGTWVQPPGIGVLWTPGYWGWGGSAFIFHPGYWGPHVGFYGGVNYGFGYAGTGYAGGFWNGRVFSYNRAVNNVNVTVVHNVYNRTVINNVTVNRVSYNGGTGGIRVQPSAEERAVEHERHVAATNMQLQHERTASANRAQFASVNHGRPAVAVSPRPSELGDHRAPEANRAAAQPAGNARPMNAERAAAPRPQQERAAAPRAQERPEGRAASTREAAPREAPRHEGGGEGHAKPEHEPKR